MKKIKGGVILALEGGEGTGKSTMAKRLVQHLKERGYDAIYLREPGGDIMAETLRNIVLYSSDMDIIVETLIISAARRINIIENIIPALEDNKIIIIDRFIGSCYVYQGLLNKLGPINSNEWKEQVEFVESLNNKLVEPFKDKINQIIMKCDAEVAIERIHSDDDHEINKNDKDDIDFLNNINKCYEVLFNNSDENNTFMFDTTELSKDEVFNTILNSMRGLLESCELIDDRIYSNGDYEYDEFESKYVIEKDLENVE